MLDNDSHSSSDQIERNKDISNCDLKLRLQETENMGSDEQEEVVNTREDTANMGKQKDKGAASRSAEAHEKKQDPEKENLDARVVQPKLLHCNVEEEIDALYTSVPELNNHFTITSKIGEGAFSSVYMAKLKHYPEVNEMFALKHILPTTHPSRMENELRCLLKIGGRDNVMGVKLCMRNRDHVVIVMPLFPHDKFQEILYHMDVDEARDYMKNLLISLKRVHQFHVIHRDIKPSNFLYNRQQKQYALVDFGLASGAFLKDRDGEKFGKTSSSTSLKILPPGSAAGGSALTTAEERIPLSPSKRDAEERNSTNIQKSVKNVSGKGKKQMLSSLLEYVSQHHEPQRKSQPPESRKSRSKGPMRGKSSLPKKRISPDLSSISSSLRVSDRPGLCDCLGKPKICTLCVARSNQMAPRAGTAGFRSPEVLMKSPEQSTAVDIWAAGVIFLSVLSARYPFFRAQDDLGYLAQIISVLGSEACIQAGKAFGKVLTLSESVSPIDLKSACMKLRSTQMSFRLGSHSKVMQSWASVSDEPFDLLSKMLDPNPYTRICAEKALKHPFFIKCENENS